MHPAWYINGFLAYSLQALLFWRCYRERLWHAYPLFYTYLFYTTVSSVLQGIPFVFKHPSYPKLFWAGQLFSAVLRFGIAAEVYRHAFPADSKLRQTGRFVSGSVLTVMAMLFWLMGESPATSGVLDSLRKIALAVAAWVIVVLVVSRYFEVRLGKNIWGMAIGLLIFMGSELVHLSAMDLFPRLRVKWGYVHPVMYVCTLAIWSVAMWSYNPNPKIIPLEESQHRTFGAAWESRWSTISEVLRRIAKP